MENNNNLLNNIKNDLKNLEKNNLNEKKLIEKEIHTNELKKIFDNLDKKILEISKETCPISLCEMNDPCITSCGHYFDRDSIYNSLKHNKKCPLCRNEITEKDIYPINVNQENENKKIENENINKYGTKMSNLVNYLDYLINNNDNRIIIFSQWNTMLKLVSNVLNENNIKYVFIKGNVHVVSSRINKFKTDKTIRIILLSSDTLFIWE